MSGLETPTLSGFAPHRTLGSVKVLVTGGTGFVGQEILRQLHAAGHSIRLLARRPSSPDACRAAGRFDAELRQGDILSPPSLEAVFSGADAVVHLVGIISEAGRSTFENIHTRGTGNVVAGAKAAGVRRFVHMSALGSRPAARSRYHQTKWAAEELVRQSGLEWTLFRPSIIYGPGDGFVNLFARLSRWSPVLPVMGSGQSRFQPVAVGDVAACFVKALTEPRAAGGAYDLCGPEVLTLEQILDQVLSATGRKRLKLRLPWGVARCQAAFLEFCCGTVLRRPPPLNRDQLTMLQEDNIGDAVQSWALFGIEPGRLADGLAGWIGGRAEP